jgi:hypothetical protein
LSRRPCRERIRAHPDHAAGIPLSSAPDVWRREPHFSNRGRDERLNRGNAYRRRNSVINEIIGKFLKAARVGVAKV